MSPFRPARTNGPFYFKVIWAKRVNDSVVDQWIDFGRWMRWKSVPGQMIIKTSKLAQADRRSNKRAQTRVSNQTSIRHRSLWCLRNKAGVWFDCCMTKVNSYQIWSWYAGLQTLVAFMLSSYSVCSCGEHQRESSLGMLKMITHWYSFSMNHGMQNNYTKLPTPITRRKLQ